MNCSSFAQNTTKASEQMQDSTHTNGVQQSLNDAFIAMTESPPLEVSFGVCPNQVNQDGFNSEDSNDQDGTQRFSFNPRPKEKRCLFPEDESLVKSKQSQAFSSINTGQHKRDKTKLFKSPMTKHRSNLDNCNYLFSAERPTPGTYKSRIKF